MGRVLVLCLLLTGCGAPMVVDCDSPRTFFQDGTSQNPDGVIFAEDGTPFHGWLIPEPTCR